MGIRKNTFVDFRREPATPLYNAVTNIISIAGINDRSAWRTSNGAYFEYFQGTANTALTFTEAATGWTIPLDDGAGETLEITQGIISGVANSFTVGTDAAFQLRVGLKVGTIARHLLCLVGFRKLAAYVAATDAATILAAYTDRAAIGWNTAAGAVVTQQSLNNADLSTALAKAAIVDATWCSFEVNVSAAGVTTYRIGTSVASMEAAEDALAADANAVAHTFDNADVLIPHLCLTSAAAGSVGNVELITWKCGYQ